MQRSLVITLSLALTGAAATAGPLKPGHVDAKATWLIHVDVERAVRSTVGRHLIEHSNLAGDAAKVKAELGIDPIEDLYGVTIYGIDEDGIVVLDMSGAIDEALEKAREEEAYRRHEIDGRTIHQWSQPDNEVFVYVDRPRRGDRRLVAMADSEKLITRAVDVIDGDRASLDTERREDDDDEGTIGARPRSGSIVFAFAHGLPWLEGDDGPASAIMERSDRMMLEMRERDERTAIDLVISASSGEDARNISDIVRGLIALGRLALGDVDEAEAVYQLLNSIEVSSERNDITLHLEADSDELTRLLGHVDEHIGEVEWNF